MEEYLKKTGYLFGGNAVFVEELYRQYLTNPASVDQTWQGFFAEIKDNNTLLNKSTAKVIIPDETKKEPLNNNLSSEGLNSRHLSKPAYREEFKGDTERSTTAYTLVREDASTGSTYKFPLEAK
ncbi:MAG: palindromic element RPE1 domain-containing protein, partial [Rickettsia endosymbiont of Ixodes ricinus]|nr:palindromic element RPE1 domain-containing protein [Rickettsia endosymbiont of Ixodes ricinus]